MRACSAIALAESIAVVAAAVTPRAAWYVNYQVVNFGSSNALGTVLTEDNRLVVNSYFYLIAIDAVTGKLAWNATLSIQGSSQPTACSLELRANCASIRPHMVRLCGRMRRKGQL